MASRKPFRYPRYQAWADDETFLNGGTVEFFDAGTSTNRDIYQDAGLTTTAPNPITLNSRGEPQSSGGSAIDIYLDSNPYKIVLKDSDGNTKHTIDNYVEDLEGASDPRDPEDATDSGSDAFQATLNADPSSGDVFQVDFQSANTTTTPTFENTDGSLGALTIKQRDGSALWAAALSGVHTFYYDGTDLLVLDPDFERGSVPEHATDGGTDAFASATNTSTPGDGNSIVRDFRSANTTTTPSLDSLTITTRDGSALWANALSGPHTLQLASDSGSWLVLDPIPTAANVNDAPVARDSNGRAKVADPSVDADIATKGYADTQDESFEQQRAQAWVNFDGTGTVSIRDHYNVSSITDNGTGDYTVNFATNLADDSYAVLLSARETSGGITVESEHVKNGSQSTSGFGLVFFNRSGSQTDYPGIYAAVFGGN